MYIGNQQIITEEPLVNDLIKVTVKTEEIDQLETETEEIVMNKETLELVKTEEPESDATKVRNLRCEKTIEEMAIVLLRHNTLLSDVEHIFQNLQKTILQARFKKERKLYGNNEHKRAIGQFADELYK